MLRLDLPENWTVKSESGPPAKTKRTAENIAKSAERNDRAFFALIENRRETWWLLMDAEKLLMGLPDGRLRRDRLPDANWPGGEHLFAAAMGEHTFGNVLPGRKKNIRLHKSRETWHGVAAGDSLKTAYKARRRAETRRGYIHTITQKTVLKTALKRYLF